MGNECYRRPLWLNFMKVRINEIREQGGEKEEITVAVGLRVERD